jgi:CubicO group peptidase (beta-lactamase class C family)
VAVDLRAEAAETLLGELLVRHGLPGASLAVAERDGVVEAYAGVVSIASGQPVTAETIFQIGSITKAFTATLVMQLVDDGLVELSAPVGRYLPDLVLSEPSLPERITVAHLLAHTSGIDGDNFEGFGDGDDAMARYAASAAEMAQLSPPGETWSYCNVGYVLLGRLVEVLRGAPFEAVLAMRLLAPAGLSSAALGAEEAILRPVALGHLKNLPIGQLRPCPVWTVGGRALSPAGNRLCLTARDLAAFGMLHARDGQAPDNTQVISPASARAMRVPLAPVQDSVSLGDAWGLGWAIRNGCSPHVFGHDGNTWGHSAYLRFMPEIGTSVGLLVNAASGEGLYADLFHELLDEVFGIKTPRHPVPDDSVVVQPELAGTYARHGMTTIVSLKDGYLQLSLVSDAPPLGRVETPPFRLRPLGASTFLLAIPGQPVMMVNFFGGLGHEGPDYVHWGGRASRRVA